MALNALSAAEDPEARVRPPDPSPSAADAALLQRLRAGEDAAFEELMRLAGWRMLSVARRMLTCEQDAQDAVQDAFLGAFKSIEQFDGRSALTTWLHRITVNACLMKLRSSRRRPEKRIEDLLPRFLDDGHQQIPTRSWKPESAAGIEQDELRALVRAKIDELPEPYREVLIVRQIEEIDTEEAARLLGLSPAAVKSRLHRARQALRELLAPHFAEDQP